MKQFDYENTQYLQKLNELPSLFYAKYISRIKQYVKTKNDVFLDVGCGNGFVLSSLAAKGYRNGHGVDISSLFIAAAKKRGVKHLYLYDGKKLPFKNNSFTLVGSFNVLEHTENPELFLREQFRTLMSGGYLLVACPNFLSAVMQSPHLRIKGMTNRIRNLFHMFVRLFVSSKKFEKMKPIKRDIFQYDDDAIHVTNLLNLRRILLDMNCTIIYESGFIQSDSKITHFIDALPILRYMMPSCFIVVRKN
jgi:SAM-dependent methyltransferase